jgi:hypothetical protein
LGVLVYQVIGLSGASKIKNQNAKSKNTNKKSKS